VWSKVVRRERRVALLPAGHPLAGREHVEVAEILDEPYISFAPSVDPEWAGFWSLDDHRGGPPERLSGDHASDPQEILAALGGGAAITIAPLAAAKVLSQVLVNIRAVPVRDAAPSQIALVGHRDQRNPLVACVLSYADVLASERAEREAGASA